MELRASIDVVGGSPVLVLTGIADLATLPGLQDGLQRLLLQHPGARVAVDVDAVGALDDAALGVLLGAAGRARQLGGDLVVVCSDQDRRRRLAVTGLDRAVAVVGTLADGQAI